MSVATQYPASAMNQPSRIRPPQVGRGGDFDGKPNGAAGRFDSHDDFYSFLDSNRGAGGNSNNANSANAGLALQSALPPAHQQMPSQRGASGDQSRPPVSSNYSTNNPRNTSGTARSRPPSYTGSRSEEILIERTDNNHIKIQRQAVGGGGRRGSAAATGRPTTSGAGQGTSPTNPNGAAPSPTRQAGDGPAGARPMSSSGSPQDPAGAAAAAYGAAIQRLKTPSVLGAVLQPLDTKVREYDALAQREQDEMKRLDDEIRALQERRAAAEARFLDAKGRHDDYQRQYQDVERAMRGEGPLARVGEEFPALPPLLPQQTHLQQPPQQQHQMHGSLQRPVSFAIQQEDDEYSDEDDMPTRRVQSQHSFGKSSQKMGMKERFRNSIFGNR